MNIDSQAQHRGASITPSARQCIHKYRDNNMVRYGLNDSHDKNYKVNTSQKNEKGADEVDNILSKMDEMNMSPKQIRKKKKYRTNSYNLEEETTDDNNSNILSKSLPSTLSPHLYSSDDNLPEVNYSPASASNSRHEDSYNSQLFDSHNQSSNSSGRYHRELSFTSTSINSIREESSKTHVITVLSTVAVALAIMIYFYYTIQYNENGAPDEDESSHIINYNKIFENNMDSLQERYNIDHNLILQLKAGLSEIFSNMDAGSFMFVYNNETGNFNSDGFDNFIDEVAYTAARYLRKDILSIQQTVILSSNLDMQEHGELINRYRDDVDKTGVLLVKEIDKVPSQLAMAFHYYCDEYDPLVKRSAIFFTLNLSNCNNGTDKKSTYDFIEKCLAEKWTTLPPENVRPLLTRVVDIIIDMTSVF